MSSSLSSSSPTISALVNAAEALFATLSGKALSANVLKVSNGTTFVIHGLLPTLSSRLAFDLEGVLVGATQVLQGLNTAVAAAKTNTAHGTGNGATLVVPSSAAHTGVTGTV